MLSKSWRIVHTCVRTQNLGWAQLETTFKIMGEESRMLHLDSTWPYETWSKRSLAYLLEDWNVPAGGKCCTMSLNVALSFPALMIQLVANRQLGYRWEDSWSSDQHKADLERIAISEFKTNLLRFIAPRVRTAFPLWEKMCKALVSSLAVVRHVRLLCDMWWLSTGF